jgi:copper(I)-binding protein
MGMLATLYGIAASTAVNAAPAMDSMDKHAATSGSAQGTMGMQGTMNDMASGATSGATSGTISGQASAAPAPVKADRGWIRWLPGTLPAAGYMTLTNTSGQAIDLVSASSPDYGSVMLHRTVTHGTTSSMEMAGPLALPPHQTIAISPGGFHFMLSAPTRPIAPGATVKLILRFSNGTACDVALPVSPPTRLN